jgi:hypothetical protein
MSAKLYSSDTSNRILANHTRLSCPYLYGWRGLLWFSPLSKMKKLISNVVRWNKLQSLIGKPQWLAYYTAILGLALRATRRVLAWRIVHFPKNRERLD